MKNCTPEQKKACSGASTNTQKVETGTAQVTSYPQTIAKAVAVRKEQ